MSQEFKEVPKRGEIQDEARNTMIKENQKFNNLKFSLIRHITRCEGEAMPDEPDDPKTRSAGLKIARIAYSMYKTGQPYKNFETNLLLADLNGSKLGNLNHSRFFVTNFLESTKESLSDMVINYIIKEQSKTGHKIPLTISADLATYMRNTRQFVSLILPIFNSETLLQAIPLAADIVGSDGRKGTEIAEQILSILETFNISPPQISSIVFDGAYIKEHVHEKLCEFLGIDQEYCQCVWDKMHKGGRTDYHVLKKHNFVTEITEVISQVLRLLGHGKNFQVLKETASDFEDFLYSVGNFSTTRFANYKADVIYRFIRNYRSIVGALESVENSDSEKSELAGSLKTKITNMEFLLQTTGIYDIYKVTGNIQNLLQIVNILPHVKVDLFIVEIKKLKSMQTDFENTNSEFQNWNLYSKVKIGLDKDDREFMGVPIPDITRYPSHQIRRSQVPNATEDIVSKIDNDINDFLNDLIEDLGRGL